LKIRLRGAREQIPRVKSNRTPSVLLDTTTGRQKETRRIPASQKSNSILPDALAFSPDGKRLFARGADAILFWDLK